ncbi:sulfocyanin-like copper-binding protein [Deinococcus peraridilitoris]|uniref:Putative multicopper oxidase n=1 Tax=Deinococcus peraridilitoris (strain DSM 19664 / LMG 22246 / CIP 109416 / KR-200) TaxID=937777 RepID=L0A566_DEIPD|nr:sulfocyanin-like copper-binding protein [Deinococcus peraridilitoris]AFZ68322.1 putative multicopper oxidase [Deinococcus peraridilitoris DSM 19664]
MKQGLRRNFALVLLAITTNAFAQELPAGPGRDLVQGKCQACHDLARVTSKQYDLARWTATVKRMQGYGAQVSDAEVQQIATYLATHYGPQAQAGATSQTPATATPAAPAASTAPATAPAAPAAPAAPQVVVNDAVRKTAVLTVVAGQGDANGGLNFNGAAKGEKTFTVPLGWRVELKYSNAGAMPHSVILVAGDKLPARLTPAFPGASSKVSSAGDAVQTVRFRASKAGEYLLVCGVGQHASRGQFLRFVVSPDAKEASFK